MAPAAPDGDELIGRVLGARYRIEARLAAGGMATLYRGVDERLERTVAVKVLAPRYAGEEEFPERFLAEARTAASFSHPNLAHVYDSGSDAGVAFMVLELLERRRSLRDELGRRGPLPPAEAGAIALDVLAGLEPLHDHGLVHCDIKPGNVMVGREGTKLIDFGIARGVRSGAEGTTSIGSLHSMSPEQLRGEPLTPASDLFAVGVLLYESLTGEVPFQGSTPDEVSAAQSAGPPAAPSQLMPGIQPSMDGVVLQALRMDPGRRFDSATAMRTALRSVVAAEEAAPPAKPDDETTQIRPVVAAPPVAAVLGHSPAPAQSSTLPRGRRGGPRATTVFAILAAIGVPALVVAVVLLGSRGGGPRVTPDPAAGETPRQTPTLAAGSVRVPNTIGLSEDEAQAVAQEAGLAWRIEWRVVPGQEPGIYDQDPAPGTAVERGAPFVMFAYRSD